MGKTRTENKKTPQTVVVSPQDKHLITERIWTVSYDKKSGITYAVAYVNGKLVRLHRYIMKAKKGQIVDHINGNGLDNRRENLRFATTQQNGFNSRPRKGASKYKGVYFARNTGRKKKWYAQVTVNSKAKYVGSYLTEVEAALAYNKAAILQFGEFARLNAC